MHTYVQFVVDNNQPVLLLLCLRDDRGSGANRHQQEREGNTEHSSSCAKSKHCTKVKRKLCSFLPTTPSVMVYTCCCCCDVVSPVPHFLSLAERSSLVLLYWRDFCSIGRKLLSLY
ncbi:unnamed protein product [Ectocarpus sp. 12 AP-2014]